MAARRSANKNPTSAPSKTSSATLSDNHVDLTNKKVGSYTKGPDLVTALMDNATDPQMLYQLISASAHAKRCFDKQPIGYLKASLANLPVDLRQLAIAYLIEAEHEPDSDGTPVQKCSCGDKILPTGPTRRVNQRSKILDVLDNDLGESPFKFPKNLLDPLRTLKGLSAAYEAIDTLSNADIWVAMAKDPCEADPSQMRHRRMRGPEIWVAMAKDPCEADPSQMRHRRMRGLWHLELFCTIFHRDCLARMAPWHHSCACRVSIATVVQDQQEFFFRLGSDEFDSFARVWEDVFIMLQNVYAKNLAYIFEKKYVWFLLGRLHRIDDKELQRAGNSSINPRSNVNSNAAGEIERWKFKDEDIKRASDFDERRPKQLQGILDHSTCPSWNLEIVLGASFILSRERYLMIDEPIFINRYPRFRGWINPSSRRKATVESFPGSG